MSLNVQLLECALCKTSAYAFPVLSAVYVFPSGELLRLRRSRGWCKSCGRIRQVEALPNPESLNREEAGLLELAQTKPDGLSRYEQRDLDDIGLYRRLLNLRQHQTRCLDCGDTGIDAWEFDDDGLATRSPHGGCPGLCVPIDDPDGMRISLVDDAEAYSLEGEYIGRLSEQPGRDGTEFF